MSNHWINSSLTASMEKQLINSWVHLDLYTDAAAQLTCTCHRCCCPVTCTLMLLPSSPAPVTGIVNRPWLVDPAQWSQQVGTRCHCWSAVTVNCKLEQCRSSADQWPVTHSSNARVPYASSALCQQSARLRHDSGNVQLSYCYVQQSSTSV